MKFVSVLLIGVMLPALAQAAVDARKIEQSLRETGEAELCIDSKGTDELTDALNEARLTWRKRDIVVGQPRIAVGGNPTFGGAFAIACMTLKKAQQ